MLLDWFFFIFTICINLEKCIRTLKVSWSLKYILFGLHVQWTFHSSNRVGQQTHLAIASWQFVIVIFHPKSLITNKEVVKIVPIYKQRNTLCCSKMSHFCYSYMIVMHLNISALSNMFCPCLLCSYFVSSFFFNFEHGLLPPHFIYSEINCTKSQVNLIFWSDTFDYEHAMLHLFCRWFILR